jgi:hypothetical protein
MRTDDVESLPSRVTDGVSLSILPRIRGDVALIERSAHFEATGTWLLRVWSFGKSALPAAFSDFKPKADAPAIGSARHQFSPGRAITRDSGSRAVRAWMHASFANQRGAQHSRVADFAVEVQTVVIKGFDRRGPALPGVHPCLCSPGSDPLRSRLSGWSAPAARFTPKAGLRCKQWRSARTSLDRTGPSATRPGEAQQRRLSV